MQFLWEVVPGNSEGEWGVGREEGGQKGRVIKLAIPVDD